jgi:hypothetical protein
MLKRKSSFSISPAVCMVTMMVLLSSCYSYRVVTQAQAGAETTATVTTSSFFWGLVKSPKEIHTPVCDSLGSTGMAEVTIKNNFGFSLITVATLGIWSPIRVEWKCGKPNKKTGTL